VIFQNHHRVVPLHYFLVQEHSVADLFFVEVVCNSVPECSNAKIDQKNLQCFAKSCHVEPLFLVNVRFFVC
jgi:hypothetical protein